MPKSKQVASEENRYYWWEFTNNIPFEEWIKTKNPKDLKFVFCPEECFTHLDFDIFESYNCKVLYGAYNYSFYKEKNFNVKRIVLWPTYFLQWSLYRIHNFNYNRLKNVNKKSLFICLNHKPRLHRCQFIDKLAKHNLLDKNYYTWHWKRKVPFFHSSVPDFDFRYWKQESVLLEDRNKQEFVQNAWPQEIDLSVLSLVTETYIDIPFITEKTFRCLIYKKPFIIVGPQGVHRKLEEWGFKLPRNIIDYSFDNIVSLDRRMETICKELIRLSKFDLNSLEQDLKQSAEYNFRRCVQLAHNKKIIPRIAKQDKMYAKVIEESITNAEWLAKNYI